jgi:hypothetical protein
MTEATEDQHESVVKPGVTFGDEAHIEPDLAKGAQNEEIAFGPLDAIKTILELQAGSLKIRRLVLETDSSLKFRPTIHFYLKAPIGCLKSTLAKKIADRYKVKVYSNETLAGLVGGVFGRRARPGHAWTCKNKPTPNNETGGIKFSEVASFS